MSKTDRAKKLRARKELMILSKPTKPKRTRSERRSAPSGDNALRPTPERIAKGDIKLPEGVGSKSMPALVSVPDAISALCIHPRKLTQAQENAARAYEELFWRYRAELGLRQSRSCLDLAPSGHDDSEGDEELAAHWRKVSRALGAEGRKVVDEVVAEGRWPRDIPKLAAALDRLDRC